MAHPRLACTILIAVLALPLQWSSAQITGPGTSPFSVTPQTYRILGLSVEGAESEYTKSFIRQASGLAEGQELTIPGDPAIGDAIRSIYRLGMFSDVKIVEERRMEDGLFLAIRVKEEPKLSDYRFSGIKKGHRKELQKRVPLIRRSPVRPEAVETAKQIIKDFYVEKGHPLVRTEVVRTENADNTVDIEFVIDKGPKVRVREIVVLGNEAISDGKIRKRMGTKKKVWWKFWRNSKFSKEKFEEDKTKIIGLYNDRGFYDARIISDSVYIRNPDKKPGLVVQLRVEEGHIYYVRDVRWDGNTVFPDDALDAALGVESGDVFNRGRIESNLYGNSRSSDVASLYLNAGYMRFNVQPTIRVEADSMDLTMDINEGDVYNFGDIDIAGNTKTREHVIRRELATIPGARFSRDAIQESMRRLMQLNYFTVESLEPGPGVEVDEGRKVANLKYNLEETGSDQLELSGTWGAYGIVLQLRFTFNNFSAQRMFKKGAWRPLPSGDGQKLSVGVQTNGSYFQQYSLSFTEPWLGGRPRTAGASLSYSKIGRNPLTTLSSIGSLKTISTRVFYEQRLSWPDDLFRAATTVGYQYFDNNRWISTLAQGVSNEITVRQAITRNSTDHPFFPSSGSTMQLSVEVAPPLGDLIQYHKWRFQTGWYMPLSKKVSLGFNADYGYLGSITGEPVTFERFVVGGSPFETSGFNSFFGKDVIFMRGYPLAVIGPRLGNDPVGGRILNRYTSELRWMAVQSQQLSAAPYVFADAANTWNSFSSYNPTNLFRSAGFGLRLFLPILGMVELVYGYNFDEYIPITTSQDGNRGWSFQFTLGQGF